MTKTLHVINAKQVVRGTSLGLVPFLTTAAPVAVQADDNVDPKGINPSNVEISSDGKISYTGDYKQEGNGKTFSVLIAKYKIWIVGALGLAVVTMVGLLIKSIVVFAASANNPTKRSSSAVAILVDFIAAAMLGSVTFLVGIAYNTIGKG